VDKLKIAIVTDSTAYIPEELLEKHHIHTIPLSVVFGEESFREGLDITTEAFYEKVRGAKTLPTTSQPAIGMFIELYEKLAGDYDAIVSVHLSQKISGTYDAAVAATKMVENSKVYPFDSGLSAIPQGFFALKAAEMVEQGATIEQIMNQLKTMKKNTRAYFMVDDLSHLQRGGRLTSAQAIVGSLLHIKPILHLPEGAIVPFEKVRSRKRALKRMMDLLEQDVKNKQVVRVAFVHANVEAQAQALQDAFKKNHPKIETLISYLGPVIGTHLGEGTLAVSWYTE
jgi:DegV family protein with EDD domain